MLQIFYTHFVIDVFVYIVYSGVMETIQFTHSVYTNTHTQKQSLLAEVVKTDEEETLHVERTLWCI